MAKVIRYKVTRQWVKWPANHLGRVYKEGDLLPENFTDRDRYRTIYPSRISPVEVEVETASASGGRAGSSRGTTNKGSASTADATSSAPMQVPPATGPVTPTASADQTEKPPKEDTPPQKAPASTQKKGSNSAAPTDTAEAPKTTGTPTESFYTTEG